MRKFQNIANFIRNSQIKCGSRIVWQNTKRKEAKNKRKFKKEIILMFIYEPFLKNIYVYRYLLNPFY